MKQEKYCCNQCDNSSFDTYETLEHHMSNIHHHDDSDKCDKKHKCQNQKCDKDFANANELYRHIDVVHKQNRHQCSNCDKHFARSDLLHRHKVGSHQNVKYKCEFCDKNFGRRDLLKSHKEAQHEGQAKCHLCKKKDMCLVIFCIDNKSKFQYFG